MLTKRVESPTVFPVPPGVDFFVKRGINYSDQQLTGADTQIGWEMHGECRPVKINTIFILSIQVPWFWAVHDRAFRSPLLG
jgi:hypothetical protein